MLQALASPTYTAAGQQFQALFWEWQVAVDMLHQQPDSMFAIFPNQ